MNIRNICLAGLGALLLAQGALEAVLPPLYQNKREIEAILNSQALSHKIPEGESLQEIKKINEGYLLITNHYLLVVMVKREAQAYKQVGPARFTLIFGEPIEISDAMPSYSCQ